MFWQDGQITDSAKAALTLAAKLTLSDKVNPEHFLIAMLDDDRLALSKCCVRLRTNLNVKSLRDTIAISAQSSSGKTFTGDWSESLLSKRSRAVLDELQSTPEFSDGTPGRQERLLAAAALDASPARIQKVFSRMGVDVAELATMLRRPEVSCAKPVVFDDSGVVDMGAFNNSGRGILRLIETEGKGMGLKRIGTPLLLFAFISREHGLLERGLRLQVVDPRQVHEALLLHLRALGTGRFNEELVLHRDAMQPLVVNTLQRAADLAHDMDLESIGEAELINAMLIENDYFVRSSLETHKVDISRLAEYLKQRYSGEEEEADETEKLPSIEEIKTQLLHNIVGQDHVIDTVMPVLKRMHFGYTRPNRPMAVLLLLGNSGTGKTQLAKEIAKAMYGSEEQLIFLEMGQFGTEYSKTIFVGAPPGLVGYGEGLLTNGLRDKPESVVLFDEVEKAHKSVFDVLLRFLDEGQIADPAGPVRDGRRCIIILTSNHALNELQSLIDMQSKMKHVPPAERDSIRVEVRRAILATKFFRPEFLNRVDELLLFNTFDESSYRTILLHQVAVERRRLLDEKDLDVHFDDTLIDALVGRCMTRSDEGARVCGKLISDLVITPLIDFFLEPDNKDVRLVRVAGTAEGDIAIEATKTADETN